MFYVVGVTQEFLEATIYKTVTCMFLMPAAKPKISICHMFEFFFSLYHLQASTCITVKVLLLRD